MQSRRNVGRQRGQVIVVAALVIAATFVGLALVLNSGIYAENLSSRETTGTDSALVFAQEAHETVSEAYARANAANASTVDGAREPFNVTVDNWSTTRGQHGAMTGTVTNVNRTPHVGWRLEQSERRSFTNASDPDGTRWQVVAGASNVSAFEMNVTRAELYDGASNFDAIDDEAFNVSVEGDSGWNVYVFRDSGNNSIVVHVGDTDAFSGLGDLRTASSSCVRDGVDSAVIDFRAQEFAGTSCGALEFSDDVNGPIDVHYRNVRASYGGSERVTGTYSLVVNGPGTIDGGDFNDPGGDAPTAQAVVYSASYTTRYARSDARFVRVSRYMVREETYAG